MFNYKKRHVNWQELLCGTPAHDYAYQKSSYESRIERAAMFLEDADAVLIGAGAGSSTAAGMNYGGKRFTENFGEFIEKYGSEYMTDMYTGGFYPFPSQEAKWGYWSKDAMVNRFDPPALPLYLKLFDIMKDRDYFVLTTNVDYQFQKAGFAEKRIFATQGDYGKIQCAKGCHDGVYDAEDMFRQMDQVRKNCLVPTYMIPKCPVCGGNMEMYLRADQYFVEDEAWHEAADRYADFLKKVKGMHVVLLELGVGFNTPMIIRFPFEKLCRENRHYRLIRMNMDEEFVPMSLGERAVGIGGDMTAAIEDLERRLK